MQNPSPKKELTGKEQLKADKKAARLAKKLEKQLEKQFKNLEITKKPLILNGESHTVFISIPESLRVTKDTPKGTRLLIARWPPEFLIYLKTYYPPGSPCFPRGGVSVYNETFGAVGFYYFESIALHPIKKIRKIPE